MVVPFRKTQEDTLLDELSQEYDLDDFERDVAMYFMELDEDEREEFKEFLKAKIAAHNNSKALNVVEGISSKNE